MPAASPDIDECVTLAIELAEAARIPALSYFRAHSINIDNKRADEGRFDPVTAADREVEAGIRKILRERRPRDAVIGEEHADTAGDSGLSWIIDPIDGTRAFMCGLPTWGVLIAMNDGARPVIGIMDQPFTGERFVGVTHDSRSAAYMQRGDARTQLETRQGVDLADAVMCSTAPDAFADETDAAAFQALTHAIKMMRYGTDCYGYAMLARGQIDLVAESGLSAYDIQAMIPIVQAAGGVITDWHGGDCQQGGRVLAAGSTALHEQAVALLSELV